MRNCLILGSGRSGTSMVGGTIAGAGYYMGEDLVQARDSNPKGFFESRVINGLNEQILMPAVARRPPLVGKWLFRDRPLPRQLWLARVPVGTRLTASPQQQQAMQAALARAREPFCYKDPRFCYTLPAWRPWLGSTVFVCIFREPAAIARSILKECASARYLQTLRITEAQALEVVVTMYRHILEVHRHQGEWLFLHYHQMLTPQGVGRLEAFLEAKVDASFPEAALERSIPAEPAGGDARQVYEQLCHLAGAEQFALPHAERRAA